MAPCTPNEQKVALDLSKHAVKVERESPHPVPSAPNPPPMPALYPEPQTSQQATRTHTVPSEMSNNSIGSCSHMNVTAPPPPELSDSESLNDDVEYQIFERDALRAMAEKNGGSLMGFNPRMRRAVQTSQTADDSYRKRRERNNYAAKQSRDRRKLREVRLALQVSYLKKKWADLKSRLTTSVCRRCGQICEC